MAMGKSAFESFQTLKMNSGSNEVTCGRYVLCCPFLARYCPHLWVYITDAASLCIHLLNQCICSKKIFYILNMEAIWKREL